MITAILILIIILGFTCNLYLDSLPVSIQWICYIGTNLINNVLLSFAFLVHIDYKKPILKLIAFIAFYSSVYTLLDFIILSYVEYIGIKAVWLVPVYNTVAFVWFLNVVSNCIKSFHKKNDKYRPKNSYLIYYYPKSFWGLVASILTSPYGHCAVVTQGKKFYYKKGKLIEVDFVYSDKVFYKKVKDINIRALREKLNNKWSIFNNCFTAFKCYEYK